MGNLPCLPASPEGNWEHSSALDAPLSTEAAGIVARSNQEGRVLGEPPSASVLAASPGRVFVTWSWRRQGWAAALSSQSPDCHLAALQVNVPSKSTRGAEVAQGRRCWGPGFPFWPPGLHPIAGLAFRGEGH